MYITWNLVILGSVSPPGSIDVGSLFDPLESLRTTGDAFGTWVSVFSAFALLASFTGSLISLVDYLADAFAKPLGIDSGQEVMKSEMSTSTQHTVTPTSRYTSLQKSILFASALGPPLAIALYDPSLFFLALDSAGTFGAIFLFAIVPVAMAWQQRYGTKDHVDTAEAELAIPSLLPGGRIPLALMMIGSVAIFSFEVYERFAGTISL
jgi:tyrosine-specific transport protein